MQDSGFGNTGNGMSGFFNKGVTGPILGLPSGNVSGFMSGFGNMGTGIAGVFNIARQ